MVHGAEKMETLKHNALANESWPKEQTILSALGQPRFNKDHQGRGYLKGKREWKKRHQTGSGLFHGLALGQP